MKSIILDLDGVVVNYDFPKILKKHFGIAIPEQLIGCYDFSEALGLTEQEVCKMFVEEAKAEPIITPGAIETIKHFMANELIVNILSNRLTFMGKDELSDWLDKYGVPYNNLLDFDSLPEYSYAMVDDCPSKLLRVSDQVKLTKMILYVKPWNMRCNDIMNRFTWVENWKQVKEEVL